MTVYKRALASPVLTVLCIAAIWAAGLAVAFQLHPSAQRTGGAYRLAHFTYSVMGLMSSLQLEGIVVTGPAASGQSGDVSPGLKETYRQTDVYRRAAEKAWGRFNSAEYGREFTGKLTAAFAALAALDTKRQDLLRGSAGPRAAAEYYSGLVTGLAQGVLKLEALDLEDRAARVSRAALAEGLRAYELTVTEMEAGLAVLSGEELTQARQARWASATEQRKAILSRLATTGLPGGASQPPAGPIAPQALAAGRLSEQLQASMAGDGQAPVTASRWTAAFLAAQHQLLVVAERHRAKLEARVENVAMRNNVLFVTCILLAGAATLGLIGLRQPAGLRVSALGLMLVFNVILTVWTLTAGPAFIADERGPLEALQAVVLAITFALLSREAAMHAGPSRTAAAMLACVCFVMFFREVDFRAYDAPGWFTGITNGPVRRVLFFMIVALFLAYTAVKRKDLRTLVRQSLSWRAWPLYVWPVLLVLGEYVDSITNASRKDGLQGYWANGAFWEELLEFTAYIALMYAAAIFGDIYRPDAPEPAARPPRQVATGRGARSSAKP